MNINQKLQKIGKNLQEVAFEMEIAARPRGKKGDYIRLYTPIGIYEDSSMGSKYFKARLATEPTFSKANNWSAEVIFEWKKSRNIAVFWQGLGFWELNENDRYHWVLDSRKSKRPRRIEMPHNWNWSK